jgi:hypothetical protein
MEQYYEYMMTLSSPVTSITIFLRHFRVTLLVLNSDSVYRCYRNSKEMMLQILIHKKDYGEARKYLCYIFFPIFLINVPAFASLLRKYKFNVVI